MAIGEVPQTRTDEGATAAKDRGISLCLSGGGFRASIFHLGALRWLNERGVLPQLRTISSVSGGSIMAGHLAYRFRDGWPAQPVSDEEWTDRIVEPLWRFVNRDVRTWPIVVRFHPSNWFRSWTTVEALREQYIQHLFEGTDLPLAHMADRGLPEFVFCATDMVFGVNWEATWQKVGNYEIGYAEPPPPEWTIARAVAASSCFPPIFPPARTMVGAADLRRGAYKKKDRDARCAGVRLTDGGVYDNLGLQPVFWDKKVLVSDGGGLLAFALLNCPWRRLTRYSALLQNGIGKLRKSWLMRDFKSNPPVKEGTYWGIGDGSTQGPPFHDEPAAEEIAGIRTDLNAFTRPEFEILQNHGYLRAADRTLRYAATFLKNPPAIDHVQPPYPSWCDPAKRKRALRFSHRRFWPYWLR